MNTSETGRIVGDLAVSTLTSRHISSRTIDKNIVDIEKDIFELQDVALQLSDETVHLVDDASKIQNQLIELKYVQSLPWFCKARVSYQEVKADQWDQADVADSSNQLFVRTVMLNDTYTGVFLCLPRSLKAGETRSVSFTPKASEACVYVTTDPQAAIRLTSVDLEWMPDREADVFVGHKALLSPPSQMNHFLFGSVFSSSTPDDSAGCVVFPEAGGFYIQTIYLDNTHEVSKLVFVFQKYKPSLQKTLPGFVFYGVH